MMLPNLTATSLLFAASISAQSYNAVPNDVPAAIADRSRSENAKDILREYIATTADDGTILYLQQSAPAPTANSSAWETAATSACTTALALLGGLAASPSGMSFCYNLRALDNTTGAFHADLRLFTIAPPSGAFANTAAKDVAVAVHFAGATVQPLPTSALAPRGLHATKSPPAAWPPANRPSGRIRKRQSPVLARRYGFVGQINRELLTASLNSSALQALLIPAVTLAAAAANTTLSPLEATFVHGLFSSQPRTMATVSAADAACVVPGTRIRIFPVGAVITGVWAAALVGVVGWGTVGRMGFRESYRRRLARAGKEGGGGTI